jgi:hypothetical protein
MDDTTEFAHTSSIYNCVFGIDIISNKCFDGIAIDKMALA